MKEKRYGIIGVLLGLGMMLIGCASTKDLGVYDSSIPSSELCTLEIAGGLHVIRFNGEIVGNNARLMANAGWGVDGITANTKGNKATATIQIPAGQHELLVGFYIGNAEESISHDGILISHNFIAGHTYRLKAILLVDRSSIFSSTKNLQPQEDYRLMTIDARRTDSIELKIVDLGF